MDKPIETCADEARSSGPLPGIEILAVLHVISGMWRVYHENKILGYVIYFYFSPAKVEVHGTPIAMLMLANLSILAILVSGIGLWRRAKWGWWLTGFVYSYVVVRCIYMMVGYYIRRDQHQEMGLTADYGGYLFQIAVFVVLIGYLYSRGVLESFGLRNIHKVKTTGLQIVASIFALAASTLAAFIIISKQGMSVPYIQ